MNKLKWHHIMDKQPRHNAKIVMCSEPYKNHYPIGMVKAHSIGFKKSLKWRRENGMGDPSWFWIYAKDFPFPKGRKAKLCLE